ncbi:chromate transporter [Mycoplana sp. MJR14]|uniref:chromate transporter n=1 Tax=Mycoplana sp. MJR14 TaxID=3032583 RepID=UPI0031F39587
MAFLKPGLASFGVRLRIFRDELVVHPKWIDEAGYADLGALSQFLPGTPRAGAIFPRPLAHRLLGALAAWAAFNCGPQTSW